MSVVVVFSQTHVFLDTKTEDYKDKFDLKKTT